VSARCTYRDDVDARPLVWAWTNFQPTGHVLQLSLQHLNDLNAKVIAMGNHPHVDRRAFIIDHAGEPLPSLDS